MAKKKKRRIRENYPAITTNYIHNIFYSNSQQIPHIQIMNKFRSHASIMHARPHNKITLAELQGMKNERLLIAIRHYARSSQTQTLETKSTEKQHFEIQELFRTRMFFARI